MKKKTLIETNPYLKDEEKRLEMIYTSVSSSSAIEGVKIKFPKGFDIREWTPEKRITPKGD